MTRIPCGLALLLVLSLELNAQDQSSNQRTALPSLRLEQLSATRERPLFAPGRRKSQQMAVSAPTNVDASRVQKQQLTLRGIIVTPAQTLVLLRDDATSELVTVPAGGVVGRWHVLVDSNYSVRLKDGAEEIKLEMFVER
jgi:general secretion pathway protein N